MTTKSGALTVEGVDFQPAEVIDLIPEVEVANAPVEEPKGTSTVVHKDGGFFYED